MHVLGLHGHAMRLSADIATLTALDLQILRLVLTVMGSTCLSLLHLIALVLHQRFAGLG